MKTKSENATMELEPEQRSRWEQLDATVRLGAQAFFEVGVALAEIRENRLYREEFRTWEDYCRRRLDRSKTQADRLITCGGVFQDLTPIGVKTLPRTESQARELARLAAPEDRRDLWAKIVEEHGEQITAVVIREAVDRRLGKPTEDEPEGAGAQAIPVAEGATEPGEEQGAEGDDGQRSKADAAEEPAYLLADGTGLPRSEWTDGPLTYDRVSQEIAAIDRNYPKDPRRAAQIQWLVIVASAAVNDHVPVDADKRGLGDLHSALHKVQRIAAELC